MSFSNPNEESQSIHPCKVWVEYKSKKKEFVYWDKEVTNEDGSFGAEVSLGSNPAFIFLDHTFSVTGWNKPKRFSLRSNELKILATKESWKAAKFKVESNPKESMVIKFGNVSMTAIEGCWADIKDLVSSQQGKLTLNAYVMTPVKGVMTLAVFKMTGASYSAFKDFYDKHKGQAIHSRPIRVTSHEPETTGDNDYFIPVFAFVEKPILPETVALCIETDKTLQEYFKSKNTESQEAPTQAAAPAAAPAPQMQQAPSPTEEDFKEAFGDDPMTGMDLGDLHELPF